MNIDFVRKSLMSIKNKVLAIIGEFLKNGEKLEFVKSTIEPLKIEDKPKIIVRIKFLQARQEDLLKRSKMFTDELDKIQMELEKWKGVDIKLLGFRSVEVIKDLINRGLNLIKIGEALFNEINTQNKDVDNLLKYIDKSTKLGFKLELPKLEQITTPIASILKPISLILLVGLGFLVFRELRK
jgi:hypothetical protein